MIHISQGKMMGIKAGIVKWTEEELEVELTIAEIHMLNVTFVIW